MPDAVLDLISDDVRGVLQAVRIEGPSTFRVADTTYTVPGSDLGRRPSDDGDPARDGDGDGDGARLIASLASQLYARLYIRPTGPTGTPARGEARRDFVARLSAANNGTGTWEAGWVVRRVDPDDLIGVFRDDVTFWVKPDQIRAPGGELSAGSSCQVRMGKEIRQLFPGFYFAIGDGDESDHDVTEGPVVRLYWHLTADFAPVYMEEVTRVLNAGRVPFRTKVISAPDVYQRADAGVLYLRKKDWARVLGAVGEVHSRVRNGLRASVPRFTRPLADGLSLAEDPSNGQSFGQHRCQALATALVEAFTRGLEGTAPVHEHVASVFRRSGIDPYRPHLNGGSDDDYADLP